MKDVQGSGRDLFNVQSRHLLGRSQENYENPSSG
jgi:hypothetical protein